MKFQYLRRFHCVFAFVVAAVSLVQCCAAASADTRFLVAPIQLYGLANRLRALEGVHIIASAAGRKLAVHWLRSTDCWVAFNELFDVAHAEASELLVDVSEDPELHLLYDRTPVGDGRLSFTLKGNIPIIEGPQNNYVDLEPFVHQLSADNRHYAISMWSVAYPLQMDCQTYLNYRSRLLRALRPVPWIRAAVDGYVASQFGLRLVVGVHIRQDREFDGPSIPGGGSMRSFSDVAPLAQYELGLRQLFARHPGAFAFVCSNAKSSIQRLMSVFPGRILSYTPSAKEREMAGCDEEFDPGDRGSGCSVKIAFIEMQILSETALIIGAYFSSFSEEAALIHMTPRLMVHYDTFIRGFDLSRPNCGDMYRDPLLNMTTLQEYEVQRSGVDPSSTVLFVDAEPCPALTAAWGIENTFCV